MKLVGGEHAEPREYARPPEYSTPTEPPPPPQVVVQGAAVKFVQATPAATWTWQHNLGYKPSLLIFDYEEPMESVNTTVQYPDDNTVIVDWPRPTAGEIYAT